MRYWILEEGECVYVMHGVGTEYYKIGRSTDIRNRLKVIQRGSPAAIELIAVHYIDDVDEYALLEHVLHKKFKHVRRRKSEWFKLSEEDIAFLSMETTKLMQRVLGAYRGMVKRIP